MMSRNHTKNRAKQIRKSIQDMKRVSLQSQSIKLLISSLSFFFILTTQVFAQGDVSKGKSLFNANCAACHKLNKKLVGPALGKVSERRSMEWLKAWIKNNNALRASGDADAIAIYEEYNGSPMTAFPQLSDKDIEDIIAYTDAEPTKKVAAVAAVAEEVEDEGNNDMLINIVVTVILLALALWVYIKSKKWVLKNSNNNNCIVFGGLFWFLRSIVYWY